MTAIQNKPQQPKTIEPGQRWTFVDNGGDRTEYVVVDPSDPEQMPDDVRRHTWARWEPEERAEGIVYLLNEKTGKFAMITRYWLRGARIAGQCYWLPPEVVA